MTIEEVFARNAACKKAQRACSILGKSLDTLKLADADVSLLYSKITEEVATSRALAVNACLRSFEHEALGRSEALAFYRKVREIK